MKLSDLRQVLELACASCPQDSEVVLSFESDTLEGAFDLRALEDIKDIRIMDDWPLPGVSLMVPYETHKKLVVIFYGDRDDSLD